MAKFEYPIVIDGLDFVKGVIQEYMKGAEFTNDVSEDYKEGFYDFGNAIVHALENMIARKVDDKNEN